MNYCTQIVNTNQMNLFLEKKGKSSREIEHEPKQRFSLLVEPKRKVGLEQYRFQWRKCQLW